MSLITRQPVEESLATKKCAIWLSAEKARMCRWVYWPALPHLARRWKQALSILYTPHVKTLWKTVAFVEIANTMSSSHDAVKRTTYNQHGAVKVAKESHVTGEQVKSRMATIGQNSRLINWRTEGMDFNFLFPFFLPFGLSFNVANHFL